MTHNTAATTTTEDEPEPPIIERPRTEQELADYVRRRFGVVIPDVKVCPTHSTPWRAFCDAYFAKHSMVVWKASRGLGGKSFLLSLLSLVEACTLQADITLLGGSGEQSARVLEAMTKLWNFAGSPRELLASEPAKRETEFRFGNSVRALTASTASVRGPHPQRLRFDEVDEATRLIFDAAMGQTMKARGVEPQTVLSSTHHYADGMMTEILKRAAVGDWPVHEWCYRENLEPHGWLEASEVTRKRNEVTGQMWDSEYELQEPNPEGLAIDRAAILAMFREDLGIFDGREGELVEIEPPIEGATYAHGSDWARTTDWTIHTTLRTDIHPMRVVCWLRLGRRSWPEMISRFKNRINAYGGAAAHDATGLGDVVAGYLPEDVEGVGLRGVNRARLFSDYTTAIEHAEIIAPRIRFAYDEHRFVTNKDLYSVGGHPPDSFVSGALAYHAARTGMTGFTYY